MNIDNTTTAKTTGKVCKVCGQIGCIQLPELIECSGKGKPPKGWKFVGTDSIGVSTYRPEGYSIDVPKLLVDESIAQEWKTEKAESQRDLLNELAHYSQTRLDLERIYPKTLAGALHSAAWSLPIAPECLHQVFISICAGILGTDHNIQILPSWTEPAILWTGFVSDPGTRKSPCMRIARKPLVSLQMAAHEEFNNKQEEYETACRQWDAKQKKEKANTPSWEIPVRPNMRHYYLEDTTIEAAIAIHSQEESKTGFSILFDELAELFDGLDQYKGGKGNDRKKLLRLWSGGDLKTDRKGGEHIFVPRSAVSITGAVQPEVLKKMMGSGKDEDGMWGRFLWVAPSKIRGDQRTMPIDIHDYLKAIYVRLDSLPEKTYLVSEEAKRLFFNLESLLEDEQEYSPPALQNALSKMLGHTLRIALVLHCLDLALGEVSPEQGNVISLETMQRAIYLIDFYLQQLRLLYGRNNKIQDLPPELLRIVELSQRIGNVSTRELCRKGWAKNTDTAYELLEQLVTLNLGQLSQGKKGGWQWSYYGNVENVSTISTILIPDTARDRELSVSNAENFPPQNSPPQNELSKPPDKSTNTHQTHTEQGVSSVKRDSTNPTVPTDPSPPDPSPISVTVDATNSTPLPVNAIAPPEHGASHGHLSEAVGFSPPEGV